MSDFTDSDYEAIEAAVIETARGRWFLAEHAKRNRAAETVALLAAMRKLERAVAAASCPASDREMLAELARLSEAAGNAMALVAHMKERLDALIGARGGAPEKPETTQEQEPPLPGIIPAEDPKRRIILVRHGRSEETKIPLADDADR